MIHFFLQITWKKNIHLYVGPTYTTNSGSLTQMLFWKETLKNLPRTGIEATSFGADVVDNLTRSQSYRRYYCVTYVFFPKKNLNKRNTPLTLHSDGLIGDAASDDSNVGTPVSTVHTRTVFHRCELGHVFSDRKQWRKSWDIERTGVDGIWCGRVACVPTIEGN